MGGIGSRISRAYHRTRNAIEDAPGKIAGGAEQAVTNPHQWAIDHQGEVQNYLGATNPLLAMGSQQSALAGSLPTSQDYGKIGSLGHALGDENRLPGQKGDYVFGGKGAYEDMRSYQNELAAEQAREGKLNDLRTQANAQFGVGMGPEAMANASRLRAQRNAIQQSTLQQGRSNADAQYGAGLTQNRIGLARAGLTGSGIDASNRGNLISQYYSNLGGAQSKANQVGQGYDTSMTGSRSALLRGINQGQITDTTGMRSEISSFQNANPYISALGNSAGALANGVASNRLSSAYKN